MKHIERMSVADLKTFLEDRNLPTTGNRSELLLRAKKVAGNELLPSTPIRKALDVSTSDPHVVGANGDVDDKLRQPAIDQGTCQDSIEATSCEIDNTNKPPCTDVDDADVSGEIDHHQAFQEWVRLEEEQDALDDEEWRFKREIEDREYKAKIERLDFERRQRREIEDIERSKRVELARKRRDLKNRFNAFSLHCKRHSLPLPPENDSLISTQDEVVKIPAGKTADISTDIHSDIAAELVTIPSADTVNATLKPADHIDSDLVPSSQHRSADHMASMPSEQREHQPKTHASTLPATAKNMMPTKSPIPKPRVSSDINMTKDNAQYARNCFDVTNKIQSTRHTVTVPTASTTIQPQTANTLPQVDPNSWTFRPPLPPNQGNDSLRHLVDLISLPKPNLMTFAGVPLLYHVFMRSFDTCIDSANITDALKLNHLTTLCEGQARNVIASCALMEPTAGYVRARKLLRERFGNPYVISEAWIKKITEGPPVKPNNVDSLQHFTDDVRECVATLTAMDLLNEVDSRSRMAKLVNRLPQYLIHRWRKLVARDKELTGIYPNITVFLDFLERAAREASDPLFGFAAVRQDP